MNPKLDEAALRKKCRSLETMLSRARGERDDALLIAADAVKAVKEIRNGKNDEAVEALGLAVERTEELARALARVAEVAGAGAVGVEREN